MNQLDQQRKGLTMLEITQFILLGLVAGTLAGILGIGGAIFVVPALVFLFGWSQHMAQGTTLAMLVPPIGILAALRYYQAGHVDLRVAGLLCIGFFIGGFFGAQIANALSAETLRKVFGIALILVAIRMIFGK
jgi:uncharacterized membrane protein YfcA